MRERPLLDLDSRCGSNPTESESWEIGPPGAPALFIQKLTCEFSGGAGKLNYGSPGQGYLAGGKSSEDHYRLGFYFTSDPTRLC